MRSRISHPASGLLTILFLAAGCAAYQSNSACNIAPIEGDYITRDFQFASGEKLPALRLHYRTLGKPAHDANGRVTNAVLILHGSGG
jgi:homoserine O-acetyltransferase